MLDALKLKRAELSVLLCDDPTIHVLNRQHRRKNKPTDVLAFAMREGEIVVGDSGVLGDVVISLDTAARQAKEHAHSLWDEVDMLLAHGLLHLLGYDHNTDEEEREMNGEVARLIAVVKRTAPNVTLPHVDKRRTGIAKSSPKPRAPRSRT